MNTELVPPVRPESIHSYTITPPRTSLPSAKANQYSSKLSFRHLHFVTQEAVRPFFERARGLKEKGRNLLTSYQFSSWLEIMDSQLLRLAEKIMQLECKALPKPFKEEGLQKCIVACRRRLQNKFRQLYLQLIQAKNL